MKRILDNIEPKDVFRYFEDICSIPHVSFHTDKMSDYCENFAKEHNLWYVRDEAGNVVIKKPASKGYENAPVVIIQGHIDMVGAKEEGSKHDFLNEGLELCEEGIKEGYITANGTTLGGDDGIAVAYALAILASDTAKHPALEAVFTVNEEVGLLGADALDMSILDGKILLNIDSEDEGIFLTGSAGGLRTDLKLPVSYTEFEGGRYTLSICNLLGGHSGTEIGTGRPSANVLMGRLLKSLDDVADYYIENIYGGEVDNAICPKCVADIVLSKEEEEAVRKECEKVNKALLSEYNAIDDNITITLVPAGEGNYKVIDDISKEKVLCLLRNLPYGVMARNPLDINLVETSLNLGVIRLEEGELKLGYSVRSSNESAKRDLTDRIEYLVEFLGGSYEESGDYPSWPFRPDSAIRQIVADTYSQMYGKEASFETIHAGLECGIFCNRIPGIDVVSYGPDMKDIHTFDEKLYIESTKRVYEFTLALLENIR